MTACLPKRLGRAALAAGAVVGLAAAGSVTAAPRLQATPVFAPLKPTDAACAVVIVENDGQERHVTLTAHRAAPGAEKQALTTVVLELDLPAGARKRAWLPFPAGARPEGIVELAAGGEVLATTTVAFGWARADRPGVATIGPPPPPLALRAHQDLALRLMETRPEDLPPHQARWPSVRVVVWDQPRSAELTPEQARALRQQVLRGGRLVVAPSPEEPDALDALGLGDLLPASATATPEMTIRLATPRDGARELPGSDGALEVARGLGRVVVIAQPLDRVPAQSWQALLAIDPPPAATEQALRQQRVAAWQARMTPALAQIAPLLVPEPPTRAAGLILAAFFVAAVPIDGWLTRRSLRRGRRSRYGALRYPVLTLVATAAAFVVAQVASGGDARCWRIDVIDVGPDGLGAGRSYVHVARGRAGTLVVDSGTAHVDGAEGFLWAGDESFETTLFASADPAAPTSRLEIDVAPWYPVTARTRWMPEAVPTVVPPSKPCGPPVVPECDGAAVAECDAGTQMPAWSVAGRIAAGPLRTRSRAAGTGTERDKVLAHALANAVRTPTPTSPPDLVLAYARRLGPETSVDGRATDADQTLTLVRYRFPEGTWPRPTPPAPQETR